jgi:hypothetical protein
LGSDPAYWRRTDLFLQKTFTTGDTVTLSRGDLFNEAAEDVRTAIFSIIFWGYLRNMRGNTFKGILGTLPEIEKMLSGGSIMGQNFEEGSLSNGVRLKGSS